MDNSKKAPKTTKDMVLGDTNEEGFKWTSAILYSDEDSLTFSGPLVASVNTDGEIVIKR